MKNFKEMLLLAGLQTLFLFNTTNAQTGVIYGGGAEQRLNEELDQNLVLATLTKRTLQLAEDMNRFTLLTGVRFSSLFDTYTDYFGDSNEEPANTEGQPTDENPRVIILPFIASETEVQHPELWEKSVILAKESGADYVFAGVLDQATTEPIEQEGNNSNAKIYLGFEGTVIFRIKLFDLNTGEEMETKEISDKGILNSSGVKLGQGLLRVGGKLANITDGSKALTTSLVSGKVNELIDSAHPKTKEAAIFAAIERSEKYLIKAISENFPAYFPYQSHDLSDAKKLEITFKNSPDSDVVVGHILEIIAKGDGEEVSLGELAVKEVNENEFIVSGNPRKMENLSKQLEQDPITLTAKLGKEKKNMKGKISGLIK